MIHHQKHHVLKGMFSLGFGTTVQVLFGFLGVVIAARYLAKDDFGIFVLIQVASTFFLMISGLALDGMTVTRFIASASSDDGKNHISNTIVTFSLLISLAGGLIIYLLRPFFHMLFESSKLQEFVSYIFILFVLSELRMIQSCLLQGYQKYRAIAISGIFEGLTKVIFIALFLVVFHWNLEGILVATLLSSLVSVL
jgi:O-antigen/teichoic acid export membrane protein